MLPVLAHGQELDSVAERVEALNAKCPIMHKDGWVLRSFAFGDEMARVELQVPELLGPFLSPFLDDTDNVRKLWKKQLNSCYEEWKQFRKMMAKAGRPLELVIYSNEKKVAGSVIFDPIDLL